MIHPMGCSSRGLRMRPLVPQAGGESTPAGVMEGARREQSYPEQPKTNRSMLGSASVGDASWGGVAPPVLELRLFGPMEVRTGSSPLPRLRSRKGLWLLALLALRAGRAVERSWLAGTLWPDDG